MKGEKAALRGFEFQRFEGPRWCIRGRRGSLILIEHVAVDDDTNDAWSIDAHALLVPMENTRCDPLIRLSSPRLVKEPPSGAELAPDRSTPSL